MEGYITDILRFALNDGPGIRTTVFMKGCNMSCKWCHNPETIGKSRDMLYYSNKCISCYKCVYACPSKAQKKINGEHVFFRNLCVKCGKCAEICYAEAMMICGEKKSVDSIMREILQDAPYYVSSGGGVTLSGGEVFCQKEFTDALIDACHNEGIEVGVETNLNFAWLDIKDVLAKTDIIMCDLKIFEDTEHENWTGVSNKNIKANIEKIAALGKPYIVRTPLIPGATDADQNIRDIAGFLSNVDTNHNLLYYELLNFNPLGASKYVSLNREYLFKEAKPLSGARLAELREIAQSACIPVRTE